MERELNKTLLPSTILFPAVVPLLLSLIIQTKAGSK